jgi:hypothetical protein
LSARDLETMPDDTGDRAEWNDDSPNRNIDHAKAARSVTTQFVLNPQRSSERAFSQLTLFVNKCHTQEAHGRMFGEALDPLGFRRQPKSGPHRTCASQASRLMALARCDLTCVLKIENGAATWHLVRAS